MTVEYGGIKAQQEQSFSAQQVSHLLSDWGQENPLYQHNLLFTCITSDTYYRIYFVDHIQYFRSYVIWMSISISLQREIRLFMSQTINLASEHFLLNKSFTSNDLREGSNTWIWNLREERFCHPLYANVNFRKNYISQMQQIQSQSAVPRHMHGSANL